MNTINEEVIKAREIVSGYKELNKKTIERVSYYDPKLRSWTMKKVEIDPNASEFKKIYSKPERKKVKLETLKKPNEKPEKVKPAKKERPIGVKYTPRKKPTSNKQFERTSLMYKAYEYYLSGKTNKEIAEMMGISLNSAITKIRQRDRQLGIVAVKNDTYDKVVLLIKDGKNLSQISKELNICQNTISYHIKNYNDSKSKTEIQAEYKEILSVIKKKSHLNQVDYCYSTWISQANCRMKSNLTTPARNKRCRELVKQGRLIEVVEKKSLRHGAMYKIPKSKKDGNI